MVVVEIVVGTDDTSAATVVSAPAAVVTGVADVAPATVVEAAKRAASSELDIGTAGRSDTSLPALPTATKVIVAVANVATTQATMKPIRFSTDTSIPRFVACPAQAPIKEC